LRTDLSPITTAVPQLHEDLFSLRLEQDLWGNFFGRATRANINAAKYNYEALAGSRTNQLENVVLNSIRQFWNAYVSQESFRQALGSRERYEKLVAAVRRKSSLGYANPGELSQVQAEFESRSQAVKIASVNYLRNLDILLTSLNLPPGTEINFVIPKEIPPVPKLAEKSIDDLRSVKAAELLLKAAKENAAYYKSSSSPRLKLIGQINSSGVEEAADASFSELTAGTHPSYYVGLRFSHGFGSGYNSESVRASRAKEALVEAQLSRIRAEEQDFFAGIERSVGATYAIAQSKITETKMREKAVQELNKTYNQGRTNINDLIKSLNDLFEAQVKSVEALGNYNIALNEWAAARDELIPDQKQESP
jgi:outer membrane protein TolC